MFYTQTRIVLLVALTLYYLPAANTQSIPLRAPRESRLSARDIVPSLGSNAPEIAIAGVKGDMPTLRRLISAGADLEASDEHRDKRTSLILAAAMGRFEAVKILLEAGANTNAQDAIGDSPLHWAARRGENQTALLLISHRAKLDMQNKYGETPLILAAAVGSKTIVKALLDANANRGLSDEDGRTAKKWAEMNGYPEVVALLTESIKRP